VRNYETMYIIDPVLEEESIEQLTETIKQQIITHSGTILEVDFWGKKKLAYEVKKRFEGIYVVIKFQGESGIANKLSHFLKINDKILRYVIILEE
jgi:small subunit ribosomal protein S6